MKTRPTCTTRFTVSRQEEGSSLVHFLAGRIRTSRKKAKAILDSRDVFVNRRRVWMARHTLAFKDIVELPGPVSQSTKKQSLPVLFEDSEYLVADKTPGILTQGQAGAEALLKKRLNIPSLVAVHRLDRDTSGCLLFAKSSPAFDQAVEIFKRGGIRKMYHAVVQGRVTAAGKRISSSIDGKSAATIVKTLDANSSASHLLLTIETGRTHQIRRHLASIGHPVVGDKKYGTSRPASGLTIKMRRQMLHASLLAFKHPVTGASVRVEAGLPSDFRKCLNSLGLA